MNKIAEIIKAVSVRVPGVVPYLRGEAGRVYCETKSAQRDPREPGIERKQKAERKMKAALMRRFTRQQNELIKWLNDNYAKGISADGFYSGNDPTEDAEFLRLYFETTKDGAKLAEEVLLFDIDDGLINSYALRYARDYVTEWLQGLDNTSSQTVRDAISYFIYTPGATIGDVTRMLENGGFSDARALRIAITEITRAYSQGNLIFGNELARQYPGFKIEKQFFTNVDDRVCLICAPWDGKTANLNSGKIPDPPLHVNCRCWTSVTVKA